MTENNRDGKYIKCSRCNCKYLNNSYSILKDFGYNRLYEPYKTCRKCRENKKIQTNTINILESAPIQSLKKYNIPDSLIDNIMSYQSGICNCFPLNVYLKHKDKIEPYKKYIRPGNYKFTNISTNYGGSKGICVDYNINIKNSNDMISSIIDEKILVHYEYMGKFGIMVGNELITEYHNNRFIKIKDYLLQLINFII